jgi:glycerophosphoryl diester phosphodiesterase
LDALGGIDAMTRYEALATEVALHWMRANYASGIGPSKRDLLAHAARDSYPIPAMLVHALKAGLLVHPYTLRAEEAPPARTPQGFEPPVVAEALHLLGLGVQGFFIDQPDLGVAARDLFLGATKAS